MSHTFAFSDLALRALAQGVAVATLDKSYKKLSQIVIGLSSTYYSPIFPPFHTINQSLVLTKTKTAMSPTEVTELYGISGIEATFVATTPCKRAKHEVTCDVQQDRASGEHGDVKVATLIKPHCEMSLYDQQSGIVRMADLVCAVLRAELDAVGAESHVFTQSQIDEAETKLGSALSEAFNEEIEHTAGLNHSLRGSKYRTISTSEE